MINTQTTIKELAFIVSTHLKEQGITAVLTGGAAVSIFTDNKYLSNDLDFITSSGHREIRKALSLIGFESEGKNYVHSNTELFVEFPKGPLSIGSRLINSWLTLTEENKSLQILKPTHSVMDRLASYYHWQDRQALDQALMISRSHNVDLDEIEAWSRDENQLNKFKKYREQIKQG